MSDLVPRLRIAAVIVRKRDEDSAAACNEAADRLEQLETAVHNALAYISQCGAVPGGGVGLRTIREILAPAAKR